MTPADVHPTHDVRETDIIGIVSDPCCTKCGKSVIDSPDHLRAPCGYEALPEGSMCKCVNAFQVGGKRFCCTPIPPKALAGLSPKSTADERIRSELDRWWAQRWVDKATPGELAAMREFLK